MIVLRDAEPRDVPVFYRMHADPQANRRGAFVPKKKDAFFEHWKKVLKNRLNLKKAIVCEGEVVGYVVSFYRNGTGKPKRREVGYWIGREFWGKGFASAALVELLRIHKTRPLYARVAKTNPASRRVAEKCGFRKISEGSYQNEAGKTVEEVVLKLR